MSKIVSPYWQYRNVPTNKLITLDQVFERQVKLFPNKTVLKIAGQTITYEDLVKLANRLANMLQDMHHIEHGDIVAIHMKQFYSNVICIIAILKAGAAFVILNSSFSLELHEIYTKR